MTKVFLKLHIRIPPLLNHFLTQSHQCQCFSLHTILCVKSEGDEAFLKNVLPCPWDSLASCQHPLLRVLVPVFSDLTQRCCAPEAKTTTPQLLPDCPSPAAKTAVQKCYMWGECAPELLIKVSNYSMFKVSSCIWVFEVLNTFLNTHGIISLLPLLVRYSLISNFIA